MDINVCISGERSPHLAKVTANQQEMKLWADHAPMNFQHKHDLVEAEKARVLGQNWPAASAYERAIQGARENQYLHEEALAYELAAKFYLAQSMEEMAQLYMTKAHYTYTRWQATAKVKELEERYPQWLTKPSSKRLTRTKTILPTTTGLKSSEVLDLATVMKASQAISGEIVLETLLSKMMKIVIENAGAQKGYLILPKKDKWFIEAEGAVDETKIKVLQSRATARDCLSNAIVNYVIHTKESVVLNDAVNEGQFTNDSYIKAKQPKSVLCTPLLNTGQLTGLLYLENNLTTGAFTPDRLEVLNLLSAQAAISIENATLVNTLEQKVEERTLKLQHEIAERKQAEQAAKQANQAKSTFLANMSHELRTPLNAILGFSQIMTRSQTLTGENQEYLGIISRSGEHLLTLINNVLDLSKIEAGKSTLNQISFDLYRLLDDLEEMFHLKADDKHLQLLFDCTPHVPRYVRTDAVKLRQVLINLTSNALKFTEEGGVFLRVSCQELAPVPPTLTFEVEDTGAGIAPEELEHLFEAFVQTETGKRAQEGTGLGLPISRQFVQLMGGKISVESEVGRGTTFKFDIQIKVASASDIQRPKSRRMIALEPNQTRYRILIVDDKWSNRQLLVTLLNPLGFSIKQACNGQEAIDIWQEYSPHLIWMDMRMPVMDGYEATKRIKETLKGQATAIIALTASSLEEERAVVLSAGCDDFIRKPFRDTDIFDIMSKHIGVRYIYEDSRDEISTRVPDLLTPTALAALPAELLANLEEAMLDLNIELIDSTVDEIRRHDPALGDALALLADEFEFEEILALIEKAKEQVGQRPSAPLILSKHQLCALHGPPTRALITCYIMPCGCKTTPHKF
jgi:signal transduction histidine kinase/CheY-like chemotaxis protein